MIFVQKNIKRMMDTIHYCFKKITPYDLNCFIFVKHVYRSAAKMHSLQIVKDIFYASISFFKCMQI